MKHWRTLSSSECGAGPPQMSDGRCDGESARADGAPPDPFTQIPVHGPTDYVEGEGTVVVVVEVDVAGSPHTTNGFMVIETPARAAR